MQVQGQIVLTAKTQSTLPNFSEHGNLWCKFRLRHWFAARQLRSLPASRKWNERPRGRNGLPSLFLS
jgi:hypothetical protein